MTADRSSVAVGLGSNLGPRHERLSRAVEALSRFLRDLRCSRIYETRPVGGPPQPPYLNMCCVGRTALGPKALLGRLQEIERAAGRQRSGRRNAPRTLDLDVLLYEDAVLDAPDLTLPHPRMADRAFVLIPLAEIAPEWRHPEAGRTVAELARERGGRGVRPWDGRAAACPERWPGNGR